MAKFQTFLPLQEAINDNMLQMPNHCLLDYKVARDCQLADGEIEEKIQVNRRKLEQMMQSSAGPTELGIGNYVSAEGFFNRISQLTKARIIWPTRLKIGAKTKKDPFVKVVGYPDNVEQAKRQILFVLECKQTRVTLKMDIAWSEHSHIIGRQGKNTQQVMKQTQCHIHFPDSNRESDLPKSNQVSIAGPLDKVEFARASVRKLQPLVVSFPLNNLVDVDMAKIMSISQHPQVQELADRNQVLIQIKENSEQKAPFVVVKGSVFQETAVRETVVALQQMLLGTQTDPVSILIEILPQQQPTVVGPNRYNISNISSMTNVRIFFPWGPSSQSIENEFSTTAPSTFFIQGPVDCVLLARKYILGCLPLSLTFDISPGTELNSALHDKIQKDFKLDISIRSKKNSTGQSVIIRGQECQAAYIYQIRRLLLNCDDPVVDCREYDFMSNFPLNKPRLTIFPLNMNSMPFTIGNSPVPSPPVIPNGHYLPVSYYSVESGIISTTQQQAQLPQLSASTFDSGIHMHSNPSSRSSSVSSQNQVVQQQLSDALEQRDPASFQVSEKNLLTSGLLQSTQKLQEIQNFQESDWQRAPGAERKKADPQQMALLAAKLRREEISSCPRFPNSQFSGYYLSNSMPHCQKNPNELQNESQFMTLSPSRNSASAKKQQETIWEDEEDKIGPWTIDRPVHHNHTSKVASLKPRKLDFTATGYFDCLMPNSAPAVAVFNLPTCLDESSVSSLLSLLNLNEYSEMFRSQSVDMECLLSMSEPELKDDIGMKVFGHRHKLKRAIEKVRQVLENGGTQVILS